MKWQGAFLSSGAGLRCQGGVQPGGTEPQYQGLWAAAAGGWTAVSGMRSEEHTSELQSLMRISYAVFCLKKKTIHITKQKHKQPTQHNTDDNNQQNTGR